MDLHQYPQPLLQIAAASNLQPHVLLPALERQNNPHTDNEATCLVKSASCGDSCTTDDTCRFWVGRPRELAVMYRQARDEGSPHARDILKALIMSCERFDEFWMLYWRLVVKDDEMALLAMRKFLPQFTTPDQVGILGALWRCYGEKHPTAGDLILQRILELSFKKYAN